MDIKLTLDDMKEKKTELEQIIAKEDLRHELSDQEIRLEELNLVDSSKVSQASGNGYGKSGIYEKHLLNIYWLIK